jgi:hypothetical protein
MKTRFFTTIGDRIALMDTLVLVISLAAPAFAQTGRLNATPAFAVSSTNAELPKGAKVVGRIPLEGMPVTHMYTQCEHGRTYLYLEHGQSFTTVDVSKKQNPQIVNHEPEKVVPAHYEQLFEGGSIQVSDPWSVNAGIDNLGARGMRSVLDNGSPDDAKLLQAIGNGYTNLADRDSRLVYFASPSQLLIVQDNRMNTIDFITD